MLRKYALILRNDAVLMRDEDTAKFFSELFDWLKMLKDKNAFLGGDTILKDPGLTIEKSGPKIEINGPFGGGVDLVSALYYFRAEDRNQALEYCQKCPALNIGCRLELREIDGKF